MPKLKVEDLKKIKEEVQKTTSPREGGKRVKATVHMGTCGIASGARTVLNALVGAIEEEGTQDVMVTTSGCIGICSREPLVTVEVAGEEPITYEYMDENKMRQVFKQHIIGGKVQRQFVLAKGLE
jgi:NADP-reducing hydrogenase subunit HndB